MEQSKVLQIVDSDRSSVSFPIFLVLHSYGNDASKAERSFTFKNSYPYLFIPIDSRFKIDELGTYFIFHASTGCARQTNSINLCKSKKNTLKILLRNRTSLCHINGWKGICQLRRHVFIVRKHVGRCCGCKTGGAYGAKQLFIQVNRN